MGPLISKKNTLVKYYSHLARYIDDWAICLQPNHLVTIGSFLIGRFHHLVSHLAKNSAGVAMQLMSLSYNDGMVPAACFFITISRGLSRSYIIYIYL